MSGAYTPLEAQNHGGAGNTPGPRSRRRRATAAKIVAALVGVTGLTGVVGVGHADAHIPCSGTLTRQYVGFAQQGDGGGAVANLQSYRMLDAWGAHCGILGFGWVNMGPRDGVMQNCVTVISSYACGPAVYAKAWHGATGWSPVLHATDCGWATSDVSSSGRFWAKLQLEVC